MAILLIALSFTSNAKNNPVVHTPEPMDIIQQYMSKKGAPMTAYEIETFFSKQQEESPTNTNATQSTTFGTPNTFSSSNTAGNLFQISVTALSSTHFIVAYTDNGNSGHGTAKVGVVSGTSITSYGTGVVFNAGATAMIETVALSSTHFAVSYRDDGNSSLGTAVVGEVSSGTTITFGSEVVFNSANTDYGRIAKLTSSKVVIVYRSGSSSFVVEAIIGNISGTTISFAPKESFYSGASYCGVTALSSSEFIIVFTDGSTGRAGLGQVDGSDNITFVTHAAFEGSFVTNASVTAISSTHFVYCFRLNSNGVGYVSVGENNGGTLSFNTDVAISSNIRLNEYSTITAINSTQVVIVYGAGDDSDKAYSVIGTVNTATNTISLGTPEQFTTQSSYSAVARLGNLGSSTKYVIAYADEANSSRGDALVADGGAALPVDLTHFSGKLQDNLPYLTWQTAAERNNEGFDIERSLDGKIWETIGFVQGHGTTQKIQNYSFTDETPLTGTNYYRLKQVDFDGQYDYSSVVNVKIEVRDEPLAIFPNPVKDKLTIIEGRGLAIIYNALGQPIKEFNINDNQLSINESTLKSPIDKKFIDKTKLNLV